MKNYNYTFNDVLFKPQYSEVISRTLVDTTTDMGKFNIQIPVISSNMRDITGPKMAAELAQHGCLGILHRFNDDEEAVTEFRNALIQIKNQIFSWMTDSSSLHQYMLGVSIGVQENDKTRLNKLVSAGAKLITIDIAHGHHILMKNMLTHIRKEYGYDVYIIAGNIATSKAAEDLLNWGADCLKVGIGPGSKCSTRLNTGVGVPQLGCLHEIRDAFPNAKLISDGGIKSTGDIAKALKFANAVMLGSFFAGTSETPGFVFEDENGQFYKEFGGSASQENKVKSGMPNTFIEGVKSRVPFRGHVKHIVRKIKQNLQSSFSYSGALNLIQFQEKSEFVHISSAGKSESKI